MPTNNFKDGSEWNRWDLHIHTPDTKLANAYTSEEEDVWTMYIKALESSDVKVFGITDYFSCDNYFKLLEKYKSQFPKTGKVFFPNIEFRLSEAINVANTSPDIHIIFNNDQSICSQEKIKRFLSKLKVLGGDELGAEVNCADLKLEKDYEKASVSIENLQDALKNTFGTSKPYLIAFPANNDGIRSTEHDSPRKVQISDTMDKSCDLFLGNSKNTDWFLKSDRYDNKDEVSTAKPVVSGSDAHSFDELNRLEGNVINFEPTWIKADLTFLGMQQICFEPEARVHIGQEPQVKARIREQSNKFIKNLFINKVQLYDGSNGSWFNNVELKFSSELTAIIGNKGSGKSAIIDIIGLLGESRQEPYFSFLSNDNKNKKFKQTGYAENFNAKIEWESSSINEKNLSDNINNLQPETVRYLPQNYFEQLTNDIEIESFRKEIEDVVFSHVDKMNRMGKLTFSDLQAFVTQQSSSEVNDLISNLKEINIEIIQLEDQSDPRYLIKLDGLLKYKLNELRSLEAVKPKVVVKPDDESDEQQKLSVNISTLSEKLAFIKKEGEIAKNKITESKRKFQKYNLVLEKIKAIENNVKSEIVELKSEFIDLDLDLDTLIGITTDVSPIITIIDKTKQDIIILEQDNHYKYLASFDYSELISLADLRSAYAYIQEIISKNKERLGTPQRKYQSYLEMLAKWNVQKTELLGTGEIPSNISIKYIKDQISYIENTLSVKLSERINKRKEILLDIFTSKEKVLNFYSELKVDVEKQLDEISTKDFSVNIDSAFILNQSFVHKFIDLINKNKKGSFYGTEEAIRLIDEMVSNVKWDSFNSVYEFIESIILKLKEHKLKPNRIEDQVYNINDFYDFLYSLSYFSPKYELRLGDKNLNELSPGEKGLLLLVFYLQLDKDNIPLIIDQPEDNLDNESIFTVLATCIRKAKKNRQVILVTHNPNLAVGADAEQIIYVHLEKSLNYKFTYSTGSIENPIITQKIIDVLEGTQPAFIKRRLKYHI